MDAGAASDVAGLQSLADLHGLLKLHDLLGRLLTPQGKLQFTA